MNSRKQTKKKEAQIINDHLFVVENNLKLLSDEQLNRLADLCCFEIQDREYAQEDEARIIANMDLLDDYDL